MKESATINFLLLLANSHSRLELLQIFFGSRGFRVTTATNVREAIACCNAGSIDMIVADFGADQGGYDQIHTYLHEVALSVPLLALTVDGGHPEPPCGLVLKKPLRMASLLLLVQQWGASRWPENVLLVVENNRPFRPPFVI